MKLFTTYLFCVALLFPGLAFAQSADYSLSIAESNLEVGDTVTVDWTAPSAGSRDWIGLFAVGESDRGYEEWEYVTSGSDAGSLSFTVEAAGTYEFRYFLDNGYDLVATSDSFVVTTADDGDDSDDGGDDTDPGDGGGDDGDGGNDDGDGGDNGDSGDTNEYTLTVSGTDFAVGDTVTVDWTAPSAGSRDWIGLFAVGESDRGYEEWEYVTSGSDAGSLSFTVEAAGTYEFRYFLDNGYDLVATSDSFVVTTADDGDDSDDGGDDTDPGDGGGDDGDGGNDDGDGGDNGDSGDTNEYTLTVSGTDFAVGDTVTVDWTAPSAGSRDWIGLFAVGESDRGYEEWEYVTSGSDAGSLSFTVEAAGTYEFRYFLDNGYDLVATSDSFVVTTADDGDDSDDGGDDTDPGDGGGDDGDGGNDDGDGGDNGDSGDTNEYTLTVSGTDFAVGDTVTVDWTAPSAGSRDWIGLFAVGESDRGYEEWEYVTSGSDAGSLSFTVEAAGTYEFRYFLDNGYDLVATSDSFVVTTADDGDDSDDGGDDTDPGDGGGDDGDGGNDDGDGGDNGDSGDTNEYTLTVSGTDFAVGDTVTVDWTAPSAGSRDWIGLFAVGESDRGYEEWEYVTSGSDAGSLSFTVEAAGTYEFRYFLDNGYDLVATSDSFVVTTADDGGDSDDGGDDTDNGYSVIPDRIVYERNATARVTWDSPSGVSNFLNWIGLYEPGAADTEYIKFEYVDFLSRTETFELDSDGTFEFRFFRNNSFNRVATSEQIIVVNDGPTTCELDTNGITNLPVESGPIIALGDSITFGVGASAGEDYVSELEDRLGTNIINAGISGDTTVDALARLESDVLSQNPSAVIVFLGGNDEIRRFYENLSTSLADRNLRDELDELAEDIGYDWMSVPLLTRAETFANIETIIARIQATGAATIVVGFDANIFDQQIDEGYRIIAENTGSFFVPDIYGGIFGRSRFMSDLVHPNDAGYDIVADRIQPAAACVI